jgi:CRP-like cAMP-binding protein
MAFTRRLQKNQMLALQSEVLQYYYIITVGKLRILKPTQASRDVVLDILGQGETYGHAEIFFREPIGVSIQAAERTSLICLHLEDMEELIRSSPRTAYSYSRKMVQRIMYYSDYVFAMSMLGVEERIFSVLRRLHDSYEGSVPITHQDIAGMAGTTQVTASKILKRLRDRGIIRYQRGRLAFTGAEIS